MKKGFTIVEVSLAVAIGGLILGAALIAVPNLMRISRDSQRKTDMEKLAVALKKYQTNNNRGALPDGNPEWNSFYNNFLGGDFNDPSGESNYKIQITNCVGSLGNTCQQVTSTDFGGAQLFGSDFPNHYVMFVLESAKCQDNNPVKSSNQRKFAVLYRLETNDLFCIDG